MANENLNIKDEISIKKETVNNEGKATKTTYFFPDLGVSVEAPSYEEALKIAKKDKKDSN